MTASSWGRAPYAIWQRLLTQSAVVAIVGSGDDAKIYLEKPPTRAEPPYIIVQTGSHRHQNDLEGKGGLVFVDIAIICRATTPKAAWQLSEAIRSNNVTPSEGLAAYSGSAGTMTIDAWLEDQIEAEVPLEDGSNRSWWDVTNEYVIDFQESV